MSDVTQLGHCRINGADDLTVQLLSPEPMPAIRRTLHPAVVRVLWPLHSHGHGQQPAT